MNTGATDTTSSHFIPSGASTVNGTASIMPHVAQQAAAQVGDATWVPKFK